MQDSRKISLAIPSWEREELLYKSFSLVHDDERISEIIVVDDCSNIELFDRIRLHCEANFPKVFLHRNITNIDCYRNKARALSYCNNQFAILLDSDNMIGKSYLDKIFEYDWRVDTILAPSFAEPMFDYRAYAGLVVSKSNVAEYMDKPLFSTGLNTANFFVNCHGYLKVFDETIDPVTADSIFMAYNWLNAGGEIHFVKFLEYFHRVHDGSHYQKNVSRTPTGFLESIELKLKSLR